MASNKLTKKVSSSLKDVSLNEYYGRFMPLHRSRNISNQPHGRYQQFTEPVLKRTNSKNETWLPELSLILILVAALLLNNVYHVINNDFVNVDESVGYVNQHIDQSSIFAITLPEKIYSSLKGAITGFVVVGSGPDLVIQSILPNTSTINNGDNVTFTVVVKNYGNTSTGTGYSLQLDYGDGDVNTTIVGNAIAADATSALSVGNHRYITGNYTVIANVDWNEAVDELNESNNIGTTSIEVAFITPDIVQVPPNSFSDNSTGSVIEWSPLGFVISLQCLYNDCGTVQLYVTKINSSGEFDSPLMTEHYLIQNSSPFIWYNATRNEQWNISGYLIPTGKPGEQITLRYRVTSPYISWYSTNLVNYTLITNDTTAPNITLTIPTNNSKLASNLSTINITFITNENASCQYGTAAFTMGSGTPATSTDNLTHSFLREGLTEFTNYTYYIRCSDKWNNNRSSLLFFSLNSSDLSPPGITAISPTNASSLSNGTTSVTISISTNESSYCYLGTVPEVPRGTSSLMTSSDKITHTLQFSGLQNNYTYTRYISCEDLRGNKPAGSTQLVLSVDAPDTTPPVITSFQTSNSGTAIVTVHLRAITNEASICRYADHDISFDGMTNMSTSFTTTHDAEVVFVVDASGTYYVRCLDKNNNVDSVSVGATYSVKIADTSEPTQTIVQATKTWSTLVANTSTYYDPEKVDLVFSRILFDTGKELKDVALKLYSYSTKPSDVSAPNLATYKYGKIIAVNIENVSNIEIQFKIPVSILNEKQILESSIRLLRYQDNSWYELPTQSETNDSDYHYYAGKSTKVDGNYAVVYQIGCTPKWQCDLWGTCISEVQKRQCVEINFCDPTQTAKIEEQSCAPEASCGDGIQNQNELGVDCGGLCNPCQILEEHPPVIQEDPLIVDNHIDENKKPNPSIEKPLLIEEKSSSFKWLLIIVVLLLVGGTSIGAIRYYQIHKPEEHDEELVAYLVQSIYNSIPIQQIMQTLAEQGWEEEELKTIMEGVQFVLSNIELDPELGKVIDKLFSSGWTMIEAKHFVDNVAIEFLILEIKRHSFMSQTEIYGMLTNDGYQREIVEKALGRVYAPQQRQQLM